MDEDARELGAGAIEGDAALPQKRSGVQSMTAAFQPMRFFDDDRRTFQWRKAPQYVRHLGLMRAVTEMEERRVRHLKVPAGAA
jgi:hypothetical protein